MILEKIRKIMTSFYNLINKSVYLLLREHKKEYDILINNILQKGIPKAINFDYESIKRSTLSFVNTIQVNTFYKYKFAPSQKKENIYSSVYACLILDMYDEIKNLSKSQKKEWVKYFDLFQREDDGLWYDKNLANEHYNNSDWWGARHLAIHMIAGYTALEAKPKYKIRYVEKYYDLSFTKSWLDGVNWDSFFDHNNDIDNKLMNVMVTLQYNRDFYEDKKSEKTLEFIYKYLDSKVNPLSGMWGKCNINDPYELSRSVQFAYHLLRPYFYDGRVIKQKEKIIEVTLKTQNRLGGYGVELNSSACEDIDSVELLINLGDKDDKAIQNSLKKALVWILSNQNDDGGFVFRRNQPFWYGHPIMASLKNESNMFATWFRTLSILKITKYLNLSNGYNYTKIPGY